MGREEGDESWSGHAGDEAPSRLGFRCGGGWLVAARVPAPQGAGQQKMIISLLLDLKRCLTTSIYNFSLR